MADWASVWHSRTPEKYEENWMKFKTTYGKDSDPVSYVNSTWIVNHKEKFVEAWTRHHLHLGNAVTS